MIFHAKRQLKFSSYEVASGKTQTSVTDPAPIPTIKYTMSIFRHLKQPAKQTLIQWHQQASPDGSWTTLTGPRGTVRCWDIGIVPENYYTEYPDRLEELYDTVCAVADGHYHCCLTGKIFLL